MDSCIFCKIVRGEIPCAKVYEDEEVLAFLDLSQTTNGHTLVIPKEHTESILTVKEETLKHVYAVAQRLAKATQEAFLAKGVNVLTNANAVAGQTVPHFHVHVLPRYGESDALKIDFLENSKKGNLSEIASLLKEKVK